MLGLVQPCGLTVQMIDTRAAARIASDGVSDPIRYRRKAVEGADPDRQVQALDVRSRRPEFDGARVDPYQCRPTAVHLGCSKKEEREMPTSDDLRKLAAWYREFAERAGNPAIWEARLRTAKQLEAEADRADANTVFEPRDADEN